MGKIKKGTAPLTQKVTQLSSHYVEWVSDTFRKQISINHPRGLEYWESQNRYYLTALYYNIHQVNAWILVDAKTQNNEAKQSKHLSKGTSYEAQTLDF